MRPSLHRIITGGGYCPQAQAFFARLIDKPSPARARIYDTLIKGLLSGGVWPKLDALYIFAAENSATAKINLVSSSYPITIGGAPTFAANAGYTGDGSSGYLDTGFTPSTAGGSFTQNSASFGMYVLNNRQSGAQTCLGGTATGPDCELEPWWIDNNLYAENNGGAFTSNAASVVNGMWVCSRTGASANVLYHNGFVFYSPNSTSTGLPSATFFFLARHSSAGDRFSADQMSAGFLGGGLTAGQAATISRLTNDFMTAIGKNVY